MPTLQLPGVNLHYETTGSGPSLLFITGAGGRESDRELKLQALSTHYTLVTYDRRGYSDSVIIGAQNSSDRLTIDRDDAASLIAYLSPSPDIGTTGIGNSSGAIVALKLLLKHPASVYKLVCHEPPACGALQPQQQAMAEPDSRDIHAVWPDCRNGSLRRWSCWQQRRRSFR